MGKAEEAAAKKKNKSVRKRLRSSASISESLNAHIAAKRRRKTGKRRLCQGMCFTLPTPEDPFNDRNAKRRKKGMDEAPQAARKENVSVDEQVGQDDCEFLSRTRRNGAQVTYQLIADAGKQSSMFHRDIWEACEDGQDVIGTTDSSQVLSLGYVPAAVKHVAGLSPTRRLQKPLALFIVASREEALSVRKICKPLKECTGIRTISIHSETPIEHQMQGLKASTPEFLVATLERLCELQDVVDLSAVSFMVVENLQALISNGTSSKLASIQSQLKPTAQLVLFSERFSEAAVNIVKHLVDGPITRVAARKCLKDQAACISQVASVIVDNAKRSPKLLSLMQQLHVPALILVNKSDDPRQLAKLMEDEGHKVEVLVDLKNAKSAQKARQMFSNGSLSALVSTEELLGFVDLSRVEVVVNFSFPSSMETYCRILASMARNASSGVVHTFCGCSTAPMAAQLVKVLKQCSQPVPSALEMLATAAAIVKKELN